ncbi:hypothetical protein V5P93_004213 [Actinokineospora auranticolor]|uniref:WD domain G-beta repeat uncharacterized protein n=1 Tax=Actinokineospora auranticolor TaxID=155976 RepID=A0A2S6GII4_9PSEU|nr:hypothetical protein [Actinokineospora auranticolor]PPK65042.1 WD domain G-beta repeat uncharacterized protein [Actinokineospora auranticolor]
MEHEPVMQWVLRKRKPLDEEAHIRVSVRAGEYRVDHTGFGHRRYPDKQSAWDAVQALRAGHDGVWVQVECDDAPFAAMRPADGSRVLYDTAGECLYGHWGTHADSWWKRYEQAMAAGETFRQTLAHELFGGFIDAVAYRDPLTGDDRYAVATAVDEGSDYYVVDYPDRSTAETQYEETVHANRSEEFPYRSCDIPAIVIDSASDMPDNLVRLPNGAVMDRVDHLEMYGYRATIDFPTTPRSAKPGRVRGMTSRPRSWGPGPMEVVDATPESWSSGSAPHALTLLDLPDGSLLMASGDDGGATVWSPRDGMPRQEFVGHGDRVLATALLPLPEEEAVLATGGQDGLVKLWAVRDGRPLLSFEAHRRPVNAVTWACPPGEVPWLITGGDDATVVVWDPETASKIVDWEVGTPSVHIVWSLDALVLANGHVCVVAGSDDGASSVVHVWDATTRTTLHTFTLERGGFGIESPSVAVVGLADGSFRVGVAGGSEVRVWDGSTGEEIRAFSVPGRYGQLAMAVLEDLRVAVAVTDGERTAVWDSESGEELASVTGRETYPTALAMTTTMDGGVVLAVTDVDHVPARLLRLAE